MYSTQIDGIDIIEHPKDEQRIGPPIAWHMWKHIWKHSKATCILTEAASLMTRPL